MGRIEEVRAAIVEHRSPAGGRRRDAESEKTHGGFGENGSGHADGGLHDDWLNDVGQNMAHDNAEIAGAKGAGCFDEFAFAGGEDLSANQTSVANPSAERERENEIEDAWTTEGHKSNREQNS